MYMHMYPIILVVFIDYCARLLDHRDLKVFDDWDPNHQYVINLLFLLHNYGSVYTVCNMFMCNA